MSNVLRGAVTNPEKVYGKSAYEVAVANGFDGTEEEWLKSLSTEAAQKAEVYVEMAAYAAEDAQAAMESAKKARYEAELLTAEHVNKWLDEHPEATTTVQDHSLTIDKMVVGTLGYVTPQMFGAKGNWESNPASTFYSSLEELKEAYPNAQSLDDEMDLLAMEYAVMNYKDIILPTGGYYFNRTINLAVGQSIVGTGVANSQIVYTGESDPMFVVAGLNILKDFGVRTDKSSREEPGSNSTVAAFHANKTNRCIYEGLRIVGFNYGLYFYYDSWCNYVNNCEIDHCNTGIYGESEFNQVVISQSKITWNDIGINAGHGRSLVVENCVLERNNYGVVKRNQGDITITGCYFELHNGLSIDVRYGSYPAELATIANCSFYTNTDSEVFIGLNGNTKTNINIINNLFECNANLLNGNTIKCMKPNSNWVRFNVKNNFFKEGCEIGIEPQYLNGNTDNGLTFVYSGTSNLSGAFNAKVRSVRFEFASNGTIKLPDFSTLPDSNEVRKFVAYWTGGVDYTSDAVMNVDTTGKTIVGEKVIRPNTVYSVYYTGSTYFIFK